METMENEELDLSLLAWLTFLADQMQQHPDLIEEADYDQLQRIADLVKDVILEEDE